MAPLTLSLPPLSLSLQNQGTTTLMYISVIHGEHNDVTGSDSSTFLQEDSCQYSNSVSLLTFPMGDVTENWVAVVGTPFSLRLPVASDYDVGTVTQSVLQ